jgi:prolyl oligopeptidase
MEIESRKVLPEKLHWVKFSSPSWTRDCRGFYYVRFDRPKKAGKFQKIVTHPKLYYHRVNTPQSSDKLVYQWTEHPDWFLEAQVTEDGAYLLTTLSSGTDNRGFVLVRELAKPDAKPQKLIADIEPVYVFIGNRGPLLYFRTLLDAPMGRVIAIDVRDPAKEKWKEVIPEAKESIQGAGVVGGKFVVHRLRDARSQVRIYDLEGTFVREVDLPGIGTAYGFWGRMEDRETFYSYVSFNTPSRIYRYDMDTGLSTLFRQARVDFDPDDFEVKQVFAKSKDGTRVPIFVTHKKGLRLDGSNPTLLYGYGGFNRSMVPRFSVSRLLWMNLGGVFAMANIRGGGEYGLRWYQEGSRWKKQNAFDDFIAAAQWLIESRYTKPEKLAVQGSSNGGLLVGAVMTQRPELFGACLPGVGVMDMLRYHRFTTGHYWINDYGSSDNPGDFRVLYAYSPYHNLKKGVKYPATLVTTADTDDRVVPAHSFKFTAALQYAQAGEAPVLIRVEQRAGHGGGRPTSMILDEIADQWTFLVKVLKMELPRKWKSSRAREGERDS